MLKNKADVRTLVFVLAITCVWVWNWTSPQFSWIPFLLALYGGVMVSPMVHNHGHIGTFKSEILNRLYDYWLTVVYGYPVFAWKPTHVMNHHTYNNKPGDFAPPFIVGEKNNIFTLLAYPAVSGRVQQPIVIGYLVSLWKTNRREALFCTSQFVVWAAALILAFVVSWKKALLYLVLPQQVALNMVLIFNYIQHVHCDEESKYNHSRNVTGFFMNFFLVNNGYHTVHHMKPLAHWSELKDLHAKIESKMDPRVNEPSFIWMMTKMYILAPFFPEFASYNMRAARLGLQSGLKEQSPLIESKA